MSTFNEGDEVRITQEVPADGHQSRLAVGTLLTVETYVTAEQSEDGKAFYWGNRNGGYNNVWFPEGVAEIARTRKELAARRLPTVTEIRDGLGLLGLSRLDLNETDNDGDNALEVYGTSDDGLPYGFRIVVESVWETNP